jgi:hypothetical protein
VSFHLSAVTDSSSKIVSFHLSAFTDSFSKIVSFQMSAFTVSFYSDYVISTVSFSRLGNFRCLHLRVNKVDCVISFVCIYRVIFKEWVASAICIYSVILQWLGQFSSHCLHLQCHFTVIGPIQFTLSAFTWSFSKSGSSRLSAFTVSIYSDCVISVVCIYSDCFIS